MKVEIKIDGVVHKLVEDNKNSCGCEDCSMGNICLFDKHLCDMFSKEYESNSHFEIVK